jgi:hypothetical protein
LQRVLDEYDIPPEDYEIMNIENLRDCSDIQDYMMELTGGRTVSVFRVFAQSLSPLTTQETKI